MPEQRSRRGSLPARLLLDRPVRTDCVAGVLVAVVVALTETGASDRALASELPANVRSSLYVTLATVFGPLLGFALTAIAILVALPSGERIDLLRGTKGWASVPHLLTWTTASFGLATLVAVIGLGVDHETTPNIAFEAVAAAFLAGALIRITGLIYFVGRIFREVVEQEQTKKT